MGKHILYRETHIPSNAKPPSARSIFLKRVRGNKKAAPVLLDWKSTVELGKSYLASRKNSKAAEAFLSAANKISSYSLNGARANGYSKNQMARIALENYRISAMLFVLDGNIGRKEEVEETMRSFLARHGRRL